MTLRALFPRYPLILVSIRGSQIKFGTRRLYVDLPWCAYHFMGSEMERAAGIELNTEKVRESWHNFKQEHDQFLTFHDKPLASVYLKGTIFAQKESLVLKVSWSLFLEYLEDKAQYFVSEVEHDGRNIVKLYREILINFFLIIGEIKEADSLYFHERENFRKLLKRTGDYDYLNALLDRLETTIAQIVDYAGKKEIHAARLYTSNFLMDLQHLHVLIDNVSILPAYLLMRNILEHLVKFFVYLHLGEQLNDPNIVLSAMFLYEYEADKTQREKSLEKFKAKFIKKFLKIQDTLSSDENPDILEVVGEFKGKGFPILGVNGWVLNDFSVNYQINDLNLDKFYSACSEIVHNQHPLPFFSLLEVKFFKHFLENYVESIRLMVEKRTNMTIETEEISLRPFFEEKSIIKESLKVAYSLSTQHRQEMKELIRKSLITLQEERREYATPFVNPLTVVSLFHLISPPFHHLRDFSFVEEDVEDFVERIRHLSFRFALKNEIAATLAKLEEMISPELERYSVFSSLSPEKKKKVIFYLLINNLSRVFEESLRS